MTRDEAKVAWKKAKKKLDRIEEQRRRLLKPTKQAYEAAQEALSEIEEVSGYFIGLCEGCSTPIFEGDRHHSGSDTYLCEACAPSYEDMALHPDHFEDSETGEPMTKEKADSIVWAHIDAGGKITDKMVSS